MAASCIGGGRNPCGAQEAALSQSVFRPSDLATRWGVSANTVRAEIERGALTAFRIGKLYRIKLEAVEEYECRISRSDDCAEASAFPGPNPDAVAVISFRHARERKPRPKPSM
ncbi:MAG: hypothetical protein DI556_09695 [Rhodovulum sulfidophilum]|uniref:Helix-turn-helix domain-containing protein n=1 Tax=Rhodovulum sulfidophilum TaxID=35806 RepID=A0A2W5N9N4_RHOSU|nr:MAG: hypothetical protein DI556_09695 [Rhodovulum sulfidophilum]